MFLRKGHAFPKTHSGFVLDEFPKVKLLSCRQIHETKHPVARFSREFFGGILNVTS